MSHVAVVIPFRDGCEHRAAALEHVRCRYPRGTQVTIGRFDDGPWCKATAVARALPATDGADVLVIADADVWSSQVGAAVHEVLVGAPWAAPHVTVRRLSEKASRAHYAGFSASEIVEPVRPAVLGGGIMVLRPHVLEECPLDAGFTGWGGEDVAWGFALRTLFPDGVRLGDELVHYWHPPQPRMSRACGSPANERLRESYRAALGSPDRMRALIGEAR